MPVSSDGTASLKKEGSEGPAMGKVHAGHSVVKANAAAATPSRTVLTAAWNAAGFS
jgi:hypothetical protein